eukprot:779968-Rhodomonas_salina.1
MPGATADALRETKDATRAGRRTRGASAAHLDVGADGHVVAVGQQHAHVPGEPPRGLRRVHVQQLPAPSSPLSVPHTA